MGSLKQLRACFEHVSTGFTARYSASRHVPCMWFLNVCCSRSGASQEGAAALLFHSRAYLWRRPLVATLINARRYIKSLCYRVGFTSNHLKSVNFVKILQSKPLSSEEASGGVKRLACARYVMDICFQKTRALVDPPHLMILAFGAPKMASSALNSVDVRWTQSLSRFTLYSCKNL